MILETIAKDIRIRKKILDWPACNRGRHNFVSFQRMTTENFSQPFLKRRKTKQIDLIVEGLFKEATKKRVEVSYENLTVATSSAEATCLGGDQEKLEKNHGS